MVSCECECKEQNGDGISGCVGWADSRLAWGLVWTVFHIDQRPDRLITRGHPIKLSEEKWAR